MAATTQWYQTNGTAPGVDTPQASVGSQNNWDFKSTDTAGKAVAGEEITAGDFSVHVYPMIRFGGAFSSITEVKLYASDVNLSGMGTGAYLIGMRISGADYVDPSAAPMSGTWAAVPTSSATGIDLSTANLEAGIAGFSDYAALQLKTTTSGASAGYGGYTSWTVVYNEI